MITGASYHQPNVQSDFLGNPAENENIFEWRPINRFLRGRVVEGGEEEGEED